MGDGCNRIRRRRNRRQPDPLVANKGCVMAYLCGLSLEQIRSNHLPSTWDDMTMGDKIEWLLTAARARAEYGDDDSMRYVTAGTFLKLQMYTYRNRISEMRPALRARGLDIVAETITIGGKKVWAWKLTDKTDQTELELR